jgi:hypothetical protein
MKAGGALAGTYHVRLVSAKESVDQKNEHTQSASLPAKYARFESSGLKFVCAEKQNFWKITLDDQ